MVKSSKCSSLLTAAACLLLAPCLLAADGPTGNLVSVTWLEEHLADADILILDASSAQAYATQHVAGAVHADLFTYGIRDIPAADLERLYQSWGLDSGSRTVVYDQGGGMSAARLFFDLYYHGFPAERLFLLDGGLFKWQEAGLPVAEGPSPAPSKGSFTVSASREDARARLPEVLAASGDPDGHALLEALGADWHFGEVAVFDRSGHIPRGILLPSEDFYNPDKTFKSAEEIRRMLSYVGIRPEQQVITYCGGGVAAAVPFFALEFLLHYPDVKLYKESEMGWLQDERRLPYWTYDAPYLMRAAEWLQFWGGQRLRMFGGVQVSIVDVRPADAFGQGHVPFALNIPAETFGLGLGDPGELAELLGPAGLDASHEAVVVSGAGLTKESALAFLMLERLGQSKVSVLTCSMDEWSQRGLALVKDGTVVGPRKGPHDMSIPPTTYPREFRQGLIVADPASTEGLYPKVFIASGAKVPTAAHLGTVAHVPYTDLLDADGAPKAAKDIWNVLAKAGVPRYAELVCFAEDPGEAAANYFILKLMGYPDVKVLIAAD